MICKIEITDTSGLFSFKFTKSNEPKLERVNGDVFWLESDLIDYITTFDSSTVATYTAYIKVYDKYDSLVKTITVNSSVINTDNSLTITGTNILLSTNNVETAYGSNTTTLTYTNLTSNITFDNSKYKDFECSVDGIIFHKEFLPISELGLSGSKTLTIRRTKKSLGNLLFEMTFTNGNITDSIEISSVNDSKSLQDWTDLTLGSRWINFSSTFGDAQFQKDLNGIVHVRGCVKSGIVSTAISTIPPYCHPLKEMRFAQIGNRALNEIKIDASGNIYSITDTTEVHINLSFKV